MRRPVKRDEVAAAARHAVAARRIGEGKSCKCGESRPEALIEGSNPIGCVECERKRRGHSTVDRHHVAGEANDPITTPILVNDHRARLSVDQYDWPKKTTENVDGSPLLAAAASIRGFVDTVVYLLEELLLKHAETLEAFDAYLIRNLGRKWWLKTELKQFAPKRRSAHATHPKH
jgi:hypothetical protein